MNIDALLRNGIDTAWRIFEQRMKSCQYHAITPLPYDVETGTAGEVVTTTPVKAFIFDHDLSLAGGGSDIQAGDRRALLRASNLPEITDREKSQPGDRLTDHKGQVYNVVLTRGDPDFYFDLTLRR